MMRDNYVPYLLANFLVFDNPAQIDDLSTRFKAGSVPIADGWTRAEHGLYIAMEVTGQNLPEQGWKIHISSCPNDSEKVIEVVTKYCIEMGISHKYLRSKAALFICNSKTWSRASSGKFITIYPIDTHIFEETLIALDELLTDYDGPYILTDVRYDRGPVFARYGAFRPRWMRNDYGELVPAIRNLRGGLEPDVRAIPFACPTFVEVPHALAEFVAATGNVEAMPYQFDAALKYSNSGGTYLGRLQESTETVVIKEARPWAGLDNRGDDAITRLNNEASCLQALAPLTCVPKVLGRARIWEHEFLALEHVAGRTLLSEVIARYPLVHPTPTKNELDAYLEWVSATFLKIEAALSIVHQSGISIGDIHPSNIILRENGDAVFVDLECASPLEDKRVIRMAAEGYSLKDKGASPREADIYSLNRLLLMMLMPIMPVMGLDEAKAPTLIKAAKTHLGLRGKLRRRLKISLQEEGIEDFGAQKLESGTWAEVKDAIVEGILSVASPERSDRLFPGDPKQFQGDATVGLAFGAAGVIFAMSRANVAVPRELVDWMIARGSRCEARGLYDGGLGVAVALEELGYRDDAYQVAEKYLELAPLYDEDLTLFGGAAGVGLCALHFSRLMSNSGFLEVGLSAGRKVIDGLHRVPEGMGLMRGLSGSALLLIHLYEVTGSEVFLSHAQSALEREISCGRILDDGAFHLHANTKYLIYLDGGSIGLGLVLQRFLRHRDAPHMASVLSAVWEGCRIPFVMQPGLFQGRAGLIAALRHSGRECDTVVAEEQSRRLSWHAIKTARGLGFPGVGLTRLSYDLATGSSGVLLAISALANSKKSFLPFI